MFDDISTIVALYGNKIILMGDFNSRTGEISDILEVDKFDIDYMDDDIANMYNTEYSLSPRCNESESESKSEILFNIICVITISIK